MYEIRNTRKAWLNENARLSGIQALITAWRSCLSHNFYKLINYCVAWDFRDYDE